MSIRGTHPHHSWMSDCRAYWSLRPSGGGRAPRKARHWLYVEPPNPTAAHTNRTPRLLGLLDVPRGKTMSVHSPRFALSGFTATGSLCVLGDCVNAIAPIPLVRQEAGVPAGRGSSSSRYPRQNLSIAPAHRTAARGWPSPVRRRIANPVVERPRGFESPSPRRRPGNLKADRGSPPAASPLPR